MDTVAVLLKDGALEHFTARLVQKWELEEGKMEAGWNKCGCNNDVV